MKISLLGLLKKKKEEYISYDYVTRKLSISLDQVKKEIDELRDLGYTVFFVPHKGIKLIYTPDKLIPDEIKYELNTNIIGREIYCYNELDSTNEIARKLAENNKTEGIVVFSQTQSKGRGRMHRRWVSPEGGLYLSVILRPNCKSEEIAKFYLISSVSVASAIRKVSGISCLIKWPNDIIVNSKKLGGILAESAIRNEVMEFLILGIGINVSSGLKLLPKGSTTLLNETKAHYSKVVLAQEILRQIEAHYLFFKEKGFEPIVDMWRNLSSCLGSRVKITVAGHEIAGNAVGIDKDTGALLLRRDNGFTEKILSVEGLKFEREED